MTEATGPKVPGKPAANKSDEPMEQQAADATKSAADKTANTVGGIRSEFRAIRNDEDVQTVAREGRGFLEGAAAVGMFVLDPALGVAYAGYKGVRYGQAVIERRRQNKASEQTTTDES